MIHLIFHVYFAEVGNFKQLICLIVRRSEKDYFSMFNAGLKNEDLKLILLTTSEKLKYFCSILFLTGEICVQGLEPPSPNYSLFTPSGVITG